jgi:hypothetical protein
LPNRIPIVQECDATEADSSTKAGYTIKIYTAKEHKVKHRVTQRIFVALCVFLVQLYVTVFTYTIEINSTAPISKPVLKPQLVCSIADAIAESCLRKVYVFCLIFHLHGFFVLRYLPGLSVSFPFVPF